MKNNKTRKIVMIGILSSLAMVLGVLEIPYPLAPWLNLDLSEVVVLVAVNILGLTGTIFVCVCRFFMSLVTKGPVGPMAIGQITAFIASITIAFTYHFLINIRKNQTKRSSYIGTMIVTMVVFSFVMFVINYLFVTPTYLMNEPTWYTSLPYAVDIQGFNDMYGSNLVVPSFLQFLSPYGQAIFLIYFPFNFLKGVVSGGVYYFLVPLVSRIKNTTN